jgi:mono/diheme cytochrome c family protein
MLMSRIVMLLVASGLVFLPWRPGVADDQTQASPAVASTESTGVTDAQRTEAKTIFAAQCSWCHGDYGMKADKGPRLAGTQMTEHQVEERIRGGKPGYMPSFRKFLNDGQITLMAKYIKSLEPTD